MTYKNDRYLNSIMVGGIGISGAAEADVISNLLLTSNNFSRQFSDSPAVAVEVQAMLQMRVRFANKPLSKK